jgi:hypothetical protein
VTEDEQLPFSEEAALRELEDLHRAIEASRVRRKDANDAFDRFLRSFERQPAPAPTPEPPPAPKSLPAPPVAVAPRPVASAVPVVPPVAAAPVSPAVPPAGEATRPQDLSELTPASSPPNLEVVDYPSELRRDPADAPDLDSWDQSSPTAVSAFPEESDTRPARATSPAFPSEPRTVPSALASPDRPRLRIPPAALVAAVLVIAAVAFFASRRSDDTGQTDAAAVETPAAAPQPAPQPAPVATPPPPRAEISTLRHVWIRVMVDGQKMIERELPANTRIPLDPAAQFVVRAGDAGAVRVAIGGKDQGPVGADGQVATKAFSVPPKARE